MKQKMIRRFGGIQLWMFLLWLVLLTGAAASAQVNDGTNAASAGEISASAFQKGEPAAHPYMGWSSWSSMQRNVTAAKIEAQARVLAARLKPYGYTYINMDSGWCNGYDTNGEIYPNHFDAYGRPLPNPYEFPEGIAAVAAYVHSLGLKFGLYLTPGLKIPVWQANCRIFGTTNTVQQIADTNRAGSKFPHSGPQAFRGSYAIDYSKPGAQEYVQSEADWFASWGVDFIKLDWSGVRDGAQPVDDRPEVEHWAMALKKTGRPIWLELSGGQDVHYADFWTKYASGCRIDGDVEVSVMNFTSWRHIMVRFRDAPKWAGYPRPGYWNDMDSLEIGNGSRDGLTPVERQTAMTLWCVSCSSLYTGADLTQLDPADFTMLTNREVIAIDQAGRVATPISQAAPQQVWRAYNADGSCTVALFNLANAPAKVTVRWSDLKFPGSAKVRDLWLHQDLGEFPQEFGALLEPHASRLVTVTPIK
jgi:hypothetical protein